MLRKRSTATPGAYFERAAVGYLSLIEEDEEEKSADGNLEHSSKQLIRKNVVEGLRSNATGLPPLHIIAPTGLVSSRLKSCWRFLTRFARRAAIRRMNRSVGFEKWAKDGPVNLSGSISFKKTNGRRIRRRVVDSRSSTRVCLGRRRLRSIGVFFNRRRRKKKKIHRRKISYCRWR